MSRIKLLKSEQILNMNKLICNLENHPHHCFDIGKVESALATAYYPGDYPFQHGRIPTVAGAMCFYLVKSHAFQDDNKRTAAIASTSFLDLNGYGILFPRDEKQNIDAFADIIERCATSEISKLEVMNWFDAHKQAYEKAVL